MKAGRSMDSYVKKVVEAKLSDIEKRIPLSFKMS